MHNDKNPPQAQANPSPTLVELLTSLALLTIIFLFLFSSASAHAAPPTNFSQAKVLLKKHVYYDQNKGGAWGTTYCGCDWDWVGQSGGRVNLESCGYETRAQPHRANRTEVEHIVPISSLGRQRQCWQNGGRKNCQATDPVFNEMEADMHALTYVIGEINADRSNFPMGEVSSQFDGMYSQQCSSTKTDFKTRTFQPRNEVKGFVARTYFYMYDRYASTGTQNGHGLKMSKQQEQLLMAWHNQYPPTQWELERNRRIAKVMGHENEFVTGKRKWTLGYKGTGEGFKQLNAKHNKSASPTNQSRAIATQQPAPTQTPKAATSIKGNSNSKIYHLQGCPSFDSVNPRNSVYFTSEAQATQQGYRKARNCP